MVAKPISGEITRIFIPRGYSWCFVSWSWGGVCLLVEVVAERLGAGGVAQLGHRLVLDLSDPLPGDPVDAADLVPCAWLAIGEAKTQSNNAGLALGQGGQHGLELLLQQREGERVHRVHGLGVFDEVAELGVTLIADGLVQ